MKVTDFYTFMIVQMLSQGPQEQVWVKSTVSELRSKLFTAERARDELTSKIKSLELNKTAGQTRQG